MAVEVLWFGLHCWPCSHRSKAECSFIPESAGGECDAKKWETKKCEAKKLSIKNLKLKKWTQIAVGGFEAGCMCIRNEGVHR